jgi:hypothetical protein
VGLPDLLCGSENWTIKARDVRRITAAEMKCMRKKRIHLDRLQKKVQGIKYDRSFG